MHDVPVSVLVGDVYMWRAGKSLSIQNEFKTLKMVTVIKIHKHIHSFDVLSDDPVLTSMSIATLSNLIRHCGLVLVARLE